MYKVYVLLYIQLYMFFYVVKLYLPWQVLYLHTYDYIWLLLYQMIYGIVWSRYTVGFKEHAVTVACSSESSYLLQNS